MYLKKPIKPSIIFYVLKLLYFFLISGLPFEVHTSYLFIFVGGFDPERIFRRTKTHCSKIYIRNAYLVTNMSTSIIIYYELTKHMPCKACGMILYGGTTSL